MVNSVLDPINTKRGVSEVAHLQIAVTNFTFSYIISLRHVPAQYMNIIICIKAN